MISICRGHNGKLRKTDGCQSGRKAMKKARVTSSRNPYKTPPRPAISPRLTNTRIRDAYIPIRDTGPRAHGRTKRRPACWPPFNAMSGQGPKGMGSYRGWVTSALTHPRPPIVRAARNPSRKPALTEPGRPAAGRRTPGRPPHPRGRRNAARQARLSQAPARARPGMPVGPGHTAP
jgi:hypothetical protein